MVKGLLSCTFDRGTILRYHLYRVESFTVRKVSEGCTYIQGCKYLSINGIRLNKME